MADSGIRHVVSTIPVPQSEFEDEEFHALIHGTTFPAAPTERQLYYRDDTHKWYVYNGTAWKECTGGDADITTHAALTTGVHGVGARYVAETSVENLDLAAHKARHENGGDDEIDVAGLSGELADNQPPKAHKASHQDGGTDEISLAALDGEPSTLTTHKALTTGVHGAGANTLLNSGDGKLINAFTVNVVYRLQSVSTAPRTATVSAVATDVITLTANEAYRFWDALMDAAGCYLKIANTTRAPVEYAWVKAKPAADELQVTVAADIAGWLNGDTITTAYDGAASAYLEMDLSPIAAIVNGATAIWGRVFVGDSGVIAAWKGTDVKSAAGVGFSVAAYVQVSGITLSTYGLISIDSNKHIILRDRATAVDTLSPAFECAGYLI